MSNRAAIVSGDGWRAAKSLVTLYDQIIAAYPHRTKTADDATKGDAAHAARTSDHNPNSADVVTALDMTHDPAGGFNSYAFADTLLANKDERIKYIISNSRIGYGPRSPSHGGNPASLWKWGPYTGDNPHDQHVHISVGDSRYYDKTDTWDIGGDGVPDILGPPMLRLGSQGEDVRRVQRLVSVAVDGIYGPKTKQAVIAFQRAHGLAADGIVGPLTWAALLAPPGPAVWHAAITATEFGGASDPNNSAYDNHKITDSEMAVALPYRFTGTRPKIEVRGPNGTAVGTIEDIGPWNINDPYWETPGKRPQAESGTDTTGRHTNLAGIDLTPALARAVGIDGKGKVDWRFVVTPTLGRDLPMPNGFTVHPDDADKVIEPGQGVRAERTITGGPMTQEQFLSTVRWLLATAGPFLIAHGYATDSTVAAVGGIIISLTPLIWSILTKTASGLIASAANLSEVKQIITTPAIADGTLKSDPKVLTAPQALAQAAADISKR